MLTDVAFLAGLGMRIGSGFAQETMSLCNDAGSVFLIPRPCVDRSG